VEPVLTRELTVAARVADGLVYVVGLAGVVAGAQLFRDGQVSYAVVAWILTFIAGAALRLVVWMARGIGAVVERTARLEDDLARLHRVVTDDPANRGQSEGWDDPPPRTWGGWH
jgi:hypothetical protein